MRTNRLSALALVAGLALCSAPAAAAPKFSRGTAIPGVIAYQDSDEPTQFWYLPTSIPVVLGGSLQSFGVKYWGVAQPFRVKQADGFQKSIVGATLSGVAKMDISQNQRDQLVAELRKAYGIENPRLLPLPIKDVKVQPVMATNSLGISSSGGDVVFPSVVSIPSPFAYTVGSGDNRLFAQYVSTQGQNSGGLTEDPSFAVNVVGVAEFVGDPWEQTCSADLAQVWNKVRSKASVSVGWGWFRLGSAEYSSIVQDLTRTGVIDCKWKEGSLDTEKYGRQLFELAKEVFQALNSRAAAGEGFFKFEPNPEPQEISSGSEGGWWPWRVSVNAGYSSAHFTQAIHWEQKISYTGRFWWSVPVSMVLAVRCNSTTASMFLELGNSEACITQAKADALNARVEREAKAKAVRLTKLIDDLSSGKITSEQFERVYAILGRISITEDLAETHLAAGIMSPAAVTTVHNLSNADVDRLIAQALKNKSARPSGPFRRPNYAPSGTGRK
jgi:hypothetical protein